MASPLDPRMLLRLLGLLRSYRWQPLLASVAMLLAASQWAGAGPGAAGNPRHGAADPLVRAPSAPPLALQPGAGNGAKGSNGPFPFPVGG